MSGNGASHRRVIYALRLASVAVEAAKERRLRASGLAAAHYMVLVNLRHRPGLTGAELARTLGVTPQNIAGLVARLADRGFLERRAHERHANVLELYVTTIGRARLEEADLLVADLEDAVVRALGREQAEQLRHLLDQLREAMADNHADA